MFIVSLGSWTGILIENRDAEKITFQLKNHLFGPEKLVFSLKSHLCGVLSTIHVSEFRSDL
jgi:hypothetical protein